MKNHHRILRNYVTHTGKIPFLEWLKNLKDPETRLRIRRRIDRLEMGNYGNCDPVGDGVFELKLDFGPGYRIYFAEEDKVIVVLLCAGDKKSQPKDINLSKLYWHELKERSNE